MVPLEKRYVLVSGNYQSGISVVAFTDTAHAEEIAHADPAPLNPTTLVTGGDFLRSLDLFVPDSRRCAEITRGRGSAARPPVPAAAYAQR